MTQILNSFIGGMDKSINKITTENNAIQLSTTGEAQLDMFFNLLRSTSNERLKYMIDKIISENYKEINKETLIDLFVQIFHLRAIRGMGKGERNLFVMSMVYLYNFYPKVVLQLLPLVPYYGSYKDLLEISSTKSVDSKLLKECLLIIANQIQHDIKELEKKNPKISYVGKWAPREGKSYDKKGKKLSKYIANILFPYDENKMKKYREYCTKLSRALEVPEIFMSANEWSNINFRKVPSVCLDRKNKAFLNELVKKSKNEINNYKDGDRYPYKKDRIDCRNNLIKTIIDGNINSKELFPHEIIKKISEKNSTTDKILIETQWKLIIENLKKQIKSKNRNNIGNLIPLVDVSGSMYGTPIHVAIGLGIIISELTNEKYKNRILTFESEPNWHIINEKSTLHEKVESLLKAPWGGSTNFSKAMDMIYNIVKINKLKMEDIPDLIVFSDMQFDQAEYNCDSFETQYERIQRKFNELGTEICGTPYNPPKIIFWNLRGNSKTGIHAPVEKNIEGVQLLSGFSPSLMKSILENDEIEVKDSSKELVDVENNEEPDSIFISNVKVNKKVTPWETYRKIIDNECF